MFDSPVSQEMLPARHSFAARSPRILYRHLLTREPYCEHGVPQSGIRGIALTSSAHRSQHDVARGVAAAEGRRRSIAIWLCPTGDPPVSHLVRQRADSTAHLSSAGPQPASRRSCARPSNTSLDQSEAVFLVGECPELAQTHKRLTSCTTAVSEDGESIPQLARGKREDAGRRSNILITVSCS